MRRRGASNVLAAAALVLAACGSRLGLAEPMTAEPDAVGDAGNPADLRFPVPFAAIAKRMLVLEHSSTTQDLRVLSLDDAADAEVTQSCSSTTAVCQAEPSIQGDRRPPPPPSVQPTDRLVHVDGQEISLGSFQDAIDGPVDSVTVLPLFKPMGSVHVLSGFARVEILAPQTLEFEPTTSEREQQLMMWIEASAQWREEQEARAFELANNQELREKEEKQRRVVEALIQKEKEAREKMEKAEYERTRMTPHDLVLRKRLDGMEFRYEVEFMTRGPIGLNWDLNTRGKAVVSHLDIELPAQRLNVIAPRDHLIAINGVDTSAMGPHEVVEVYLNSALPRNLVFLVATSAEKAAAQAASSATTQAVMNWTLAFTAPEVLRGWEVRLHLANWSISPEPNTATNTSRAPMRLELATPITGCQHYSTASSSVDDEVEGTVFLAYRGSCSFIDKANNARTANGKALVVVNNVKGDGRFKPTAASTGEHVELPVTLLSKLDGEIIMSVMEHAEALVRIYEERPDQVPTPVTEPARLTNQELVIARDEKKSSRVMTFWHINASSSLPAKEAGTDQSSSSASFEFRVLPALFGGKIPTMPFRVVAAFPQETACHRQGLGILATRAVVLVKRGDCSFGMKLRAVQEVGGAGMVMVNSDESLIPLMSDPKELQGLKIWAATIGLRNGTTILDVLAKNKNLPSLVKVAPPPAPAVEDSATATD